MARVPGRSPGDGTAAAPASALLAAVRFQFACGVRLALRVGTVLAGVFAVSAGTSLTPEGPLRAVSGAVLAAPPAGWAGRLALALAVLPVVLWAAPRLAQADRGWIGHLPLDGRTRRRAAWIGLAVAAAPVAALWLGGWIVGPAFGRPRLLAALLALPLALAGVTLAAARSGGAWARPCGALAAVAATRSDATGLLVAAALVVAGDRLAGWTPRRRGRPAAYLAVTARSVPRRSGALSGRIAWRAGGARLLAAPLAAVPPLAAAFFCARNNPASAGLVGTATRAATGFALLAVTLQAVAVLAARRPPWGWLRSLPFTAARRVGSDAALVGALCVPAVAGALWLDPWSIVAVLPMAALVVLRAVTAVRAADGTSRLPFALFLVEAGLLAVAAGVTAWAAVPYALALPWAWRAAVEAERAQKPGRWAAIARADGDPLAWSGR